MTQTPVRLTDMLPLAEAQKHVGIIVKNSLDWKCASTWASNIK